MADHAEVAFVGEADAAVGADQEGHAAGQQAEEGAAPGPVHGAIGIGDKGQPTTDHRRPSDKDPLRARPKPIFLQGYNSCSGVGIT
ncbi:hypothetical protein CYPRO_2918 [Cyclonatronum proteinivorum]|uniref:Uncharacterized protein n=1 Tax=Cyclonatronum proteinivorum TaxID=1457365 RepID=A0A345UNV4_9BACT|nr:hypothetical protein CYPRO_2918 [Cyclonatronum proteinivorum]